MSNIEQAIRPPFIPPADTYRALSGARIDPRRARDLGLIVDYVGADCTAVVRAEVESRLRGDPAFRDLAIPLIAAMRAGRTRRSCVANDEAEAVARLRAAMAAIDAAPAAPLRLAGSGDALPRDADARARWYAALPPVVVALIGALALASLATLVGVAVLLLRAIRP